MDRPNSPPTKSVSFAASDSTSPSTAVPSSSSSSPSISVSTILPLSDSADQDATRNGSGTATATTTTSVPRPGPKRRRSSIKQGVQMPYKPPPEEYTHPDPLIRRLRLNNGYGTRVSLAREFGRDAKLVVFYFGATWRASSNEPFELVEQFQRRFPHQCKVVFVSVDETRRAYDHNAKGKNYLSMEWNDGSNLGGPSESGPDDELGDARAPPLEPFLLAGDPDLEEDTAVDPLTPASLYLRPYSRVHLADKWQVLGVPQLVVYHLESRSVLTYHARFELLREGKMEDTWAKWSKGEKITFGFYDLVHALRWTITFLIVSVVYLVAVKQGWCPNYVATWSGSLSEQFNRPHPPLPAGVVPGGGPVKIEL